MKLINSLPSVLEEEQKKILRNFLLQQADLRQIVWEDILDQKIKDLDTLVLERTPFLEKFSYEELKNELQDMYINSVALLKEDAIIRDTLATHELIHKDEVKARQDLNLKTIDLISAESDQQQINVDFKDNILRLQPSKVQYFEPSQIHIQYYPDFLEYVIANTPDTERFSSGTFTGYWASEIYVKERMEVGAVITMDYPSVITFNNLNIKGASVYPLELKKVEYYDATAASWVDITIDMDYNKDFLLTWDQSYQAKMIRVELVQPHYDYIWNKTLNDVAIIRDYILKGRDINIIKNNRVDRVLAGKDMKLIDYKKITNMFKYELGAYNIQVYNRTYINQPGIFRSRRFYEEDVIDTVRIEAEDNTPNVSEITYRIIQSDDSYVVTDITGSSTINLPLGVDIPVSKLFVNNERFSNLDSNKIPLEYYPYIDTTHDIVVKVDGELGTRVSEFTFSEDLEYQVSGRSIYTNKNLSGSIVTVTYYHKTNYVILEIEMETGADGYAFFSPEVSSIKMYVNGESVI